MFRWKCHGLAADDSGPTFFPTHFFMQDSRAWNIRDRNIPNGDVSSDSHNYLKNIWANYYNPKRELRALCQGIPY